MKSTCGVRESRGENAKLKADCLQTSQSARHVVQWKACKQEGEGHILLVDGFRASVRWCLVNATCRLGVHASAQRYERKKTCGGRKVRPLQGSASPRRLGVYSSRHQRPPSQLCLFWLVPHPLGLSACSASRRRVVWSQRSCLGVALAYRSPCGRCSPRCLRPDKPGSLAPPQPKPETPGAGQTCSCAPPLPDPKPHSPIWEPRYARVTGV